MSQTLRLEPLGAGDLIKVAHIRVAPDQLIYSGSVAEAFGAAEEGVDFHAILEGAEAAGFFKIDRAYDIRFPFVPAGALGLRAFMVDHGRQGEGIASRAVRLLPDYLRALYPHAKVIYLTVNKVNSGAIRAYLKGGFTDTGEEWPHGDAGLQHIMRMTLAQPAPTA
ncbi:GNAT family N-acetyltransferase [Marimonas sp. MJW-29]|uniref:GNAT family N-acetyltransferase n=1 Tax=Sulfitobacter sediminis TaxID=3234186 RepID=A0ABV3RMA0_9RHOB